jgi:GTP-binding protein LepA
VGLLTAAIKEVGQAKVGDTITGAGKAAAAEPLPGYREPLPMVFSGLYPVDSDDFPDLRDALDKLRLNDASFTFEPETSAALGFGFRCGFLGLLHLEIITERLDREFNIPLVATAPNGALPRPAGGREPRRGRARVGRGVQPAGPAAAQQDRPHRPSRRSRR